MPLCTFRECMWWSNSRLHWNLLVCNSGGWVEATGEGSSAAYCRLVPGQRIWKAKNGL